MSISSAVQSGTCAMTSPVLGLKMSKYRVLCEVLDFPPTMNPVLLISCATIDFLYISTAPDGFFIRNQPLRVPQRVAYYAERCASLSIPLRRRSISPPGGARLCLWLRQNEFAMSGLFSVNLVSEAGSANAIQLFEIAGGVVPPGGM